MKKAMSSTYHGKRGMYNDAPVVVDMEQSVREMRKVWNDLDDYGFCIRYATRYGFHADDVYEMLERAKRRVKDERNAD